MRKFWSFVRLTIFILLISTAFSFFIVSRFFSKDNNVDKEQPDNNIIQKQQGDITILNIDAITAIPIKDTEFKIIEVESGKVVQVLITDQEGRATSKLLDYDTGYRIEQTNTPMPYELFNEVINIEISSDRYELVIQNKFFEYVKETQRLEDGTIVITKLYNPVDILMQNPELPNGCEITSLTAVLNSFGYGVSKTEMADVYLPKEPFSRHGHRLYGANPYKAFAGDPREQSGFFVYAPPIVQAANDYLQEVGGVNKAYDVSGSTREEIIQLLNKGLPVITWVTLDLSEPKLNYYWYLRDTEEKFIAPVNLHSVVLKGYDETNVFVMDPLQGHILRNLNDFFNSYYALGSHAVIVQ